MGSAGSKKEGFFCRVQPLIPIIILNWNGLEVTLECLQALKDQSYQNFEIHLVDNGSVDSEKVALQKLADKNPKLIFYNNPKNKGFARGVNQVLKELLKLKKYRFVATLNNDAVPNKNWLAGLVEAAIAHKWDMVASKQLFYEKPQIIDNAGLTLLTTTEILPIGAREYAKDFEDSFECLCPSAGAGLYKLKVFEKVGLFNPKFKTCYEDAELGLRAAIAGFKCGFSPKAKVLHRVSYSVNRIKKRDYGVILQFNMLTTYFGLMPKSFKLKNGWKAAMRSTILVVLGVLTFRFALVRSQWNGWRMFWADKNRIHEGKLGLSKKQLAHLHQPFLRYYFKYLKQFIFSGKPTVLE